LAERQTIISFELKKQHKAFALRQRSKSRNHCFCEDICDIMTVQAPRPRSFGIIMSTAKFEPFGELLPENGLGKREQPKAASSILSAVGQSFFWLLVVAIVVTRVAYFSPAPSFAPQAASALIHSAQR
jgi:hypothetical protein